MGARKIQPQRLDIQGYQAKTSYARSYARSPRSQHRTTSPARSPHPAAKPLRPSDITRAANQGFKLPRHEYETADNPPPSRVGRDGFRQFPSELSESSVASATVATPPRPRLSASHAAHRRLSLSYICGTNNSYFAAMVATISNVRLRAVLNSLAGHYTIRPLLFKLFCYGFQRGRAATREGEQIRRSTISMGFDTLLFRRRTP